MSPVSTDKKKTYNRAYYLANKDKLIRRGRTPKARARAKRYREANPEKMRARVSQHQEKKRGFLREAKAKPCADCGGEYPSWVMDLDHVRGDKELSIGKELHAVSVTALLTEIEKCEVVCANCHRERTEMRRKGGDIYARESIRF